MTGRRTWRIAAAALGLSMTIGLPALGQDGPPTDKADLDTVSPKYGTWGYDRTGQDLSVAPGTDFFRYANGAWYDREQIPPDRSHSGNFDKLAILSENRIRMLMEDAAAGRLRDPDATKVGAAYSAFMNKALADQLDAKPLAADLAAITNESSRTDVATVMGTAAKNLQSAIFGVSISPDEKDPDRYSVHLGAAGLGLPDRDYYLKPEFADKKAAYQAYVAQMLGMIGWSDPQASAQAVVDFETSIAQASWTRSEERDPIKTYNPMTVDALAAYAPGFDFQAFLAGADLGSVSQLVVSDNTAFPKIAALFAAAPMSTLKAWQAFHLADDAAPELSDRFVQANFDFQSKTLAGQPQIKPRWKRGVAFVDGVLGEAVGRLYVAKYFPPEAKAKMDALVGNIKAAMAARIQNVAWMSPQTKARALQKLSLLNVKIGYPSKWRDYSAYSVSADDLYGDAERGAAFDWERQVKRMNGPVDKAEWDMTPQTVNAYYDPGKNEVVFPAAILQPPFFDPHADPAVNYGGIGAVIGHEITHGFDDQGRHYDGHGMLSEWWTADDAAKFQARIAVLGAQFSQFEPLPGAHVNGDLTMGENIADLGGVLLALDAYHASLHGQPAPVIDGLTGEQRFFLGFAQVWREKVRDDAQRQWLVSDPHSPAHYRVDGAVRNVDGWYAAFDIKPTDPEYLPPDKRARIW